MSNLVKGRGQRLIPEYLLKYLEKQKENGVNITQLVDSNGNPRFIEGKGTPVVQEGINITQCEWSLCGTHLMFVCAGSVADTTVISNATNLAVYTLPDFVKAKIEPVWASNYIDRKVATFYGSDWSSQTAPLVLAKFTNINLQMSGSLTLTADRSFRIQFDYLIPSE